MTDTRIPSEGPPPLSSTSSPRRPGEPSRPPPDFELLLRDVLATAFGTALHLTRHRQDAEDLVQEASLLAFRAFHDFEPGTNFKAWFFRILMNRFYTTQRRKRPESSVEELEEAQALYLYRRTRELGMHDGPGDPVRVVLGRLARDDIERALASLPDEFRVVCSLYFIEDFSYQEIAEMVGVPIGTVRSRLHRGRRHLQRMLWAIAEDQGLVPRGSPRPTEGAA